MPRMVPQEALHAEREKRKLLKEKLDALERSVQDVVLVIEELTEHARRTGQRRSAKITVDLIDGEPLLSIHSVPIEDQPQLRIVNDDL